MNDPVAILEAMVAKAREIPELLAEVGGDEERIYGWRDRYPGDSSLALALAEQDERSVLFAIDRITPQTGGLYWDFRYVVQFRPFPENEPDGGSVWRMIRALINGKTADGARWLHQCFAPGTLAPTTFQTERRALLGPDAAPMEMLLGVVVIGDKTP